MGIADRHRDHYTQSHRHSYSEQAVPRALRSGTTIPSCTGLMALQTSANIPLQSLHPLPGTIFLLLHAKTWTLSKLPSKRTSSTLSTSHVSDSHPSVTPTHSPQHIVCISDFVDDVFIHSNGPESSTTLGLCYKSSPGGGTSWTPMKLQCNCLVEFMRTRHRERCL